MKTARKTPTKPRKAITGRPTRASPAKIDPKPADSAKTKQARLIALLRPDAGATIAELAQALEWQPHSVRGVMSGVLRKRLKLTIEKLPTDGSAPRYRIAR
jgi:hypothetical protein